MSSRSETWRFFTVDYRSVRQDDALAARGPGTFGFYRDLGLVSVLSPEPRAEPLEVNFPLACAREVMRDGRSVSFAIEPLRGDGATTRVHLETFSDEVAAEIAHRLARRQRSAAASGQDSYRHAHLGFIERLKVFTPHPFVTYGLIATNALVFLAMLVRGAGFLEIDSHVHMVWGANFGPATASGEWWRLLACIFLHFGVIHLAMNTWALYDAGRVVERLFGHRSFLAIYLIAGVTGSVASLLWNPASISAGASGAVFGVFGALLAYFLRQPGSVPAAVLARLRLVTIAFVAYALLFGFLVPRIDNAAHVGGLIGGFLQGLLLARPLDVVSRHRGAWVRIGFSALVGAAMLAGLLAFVPKPHFDYRQEVAFGDAVWAFAREEKRISRQFKAKRREFEAGRLTAQDFARWLDGFQGPGLEAEVERIAAIELSGAAPSRGKQKLVLEYIGLRRDATRHYAQYLRTGDPETLQRVRADNAKADALVKELLAPPGAESSASRSTASPPGSPAAD
jgi:rhomboid protease GluP